MYGLQREPVFVVPLETLYFITIFAQPLLLLGVGGMGQGAFSDVI